VIAKDPTIHTLPCEDPTIHTLPCDIFMSENKRRFVTEIVINDKSQGTVARHLRYCGIFNDNLLQIRLSLLMKKF